jgi:hypothetical protein
MTNLLTTTKVAERLGINSSRVRQLAIAHNIGTKINDRTRVFTEEDIAMLQSIRQPTGRPKFRFATMITDAVDVEPTLAEISAMVAGSGTVTDPIFGDEQTVAISRGLYDRFTAALDAAPTTGPLVIAGRALVNHADVAETAVDFPVAAFERFAAIQGA